jgi:hypothetical protein
MVVDVLFTSSHHCYLSAEQSVQVCARCDLIRPVLSTKVIPGSCSHSVSNFRMIMKHLFDVLDPVAFICSLTNFLPKNCYQMMTGWTET